MKKITFLFAFVLMSAMAFGQMRNVTFSVDLSGESGFTTPYIFGSFNGWNASEIALQDQGNDIWSITLQLGDGNYFYKFNLDGSTIEDITLGSVCGVTSGGFTNRYVQVEGQDKTTMTAPFGGCGEASSNPGPHDLTISVDMSGYTGDLTGKMVYINGQNHNNQGFGEWCGACNALNDMGNGIWGKTIPLEEFTYEFKFTINGWSEQESFSPGDPGTVTDGSNNTNRFVQMHEDRTLSFVWNAGKVLSVDDASLINSSVYGNPTDTEWLIKTPDTKIKSVQVFNILGKQVYADDLDSDQVTIPADKLRTGIYIARIRTELGLKTIKLLRK